MPTLHLDSRGPLRLVSIGLKHWNGAEMKISNSPFFFLVHEAAGRRNYSRQRVPNFSGCASSMDGKSAY